MNCCNDAIFQHTESSQHTEINHHSMEGEIHHPNMNCVRDEADDQMIQDSRTTADKGNYERSISGSKHGRIGVC